MTESKNIGAEIVDLPAEVRAELGAVLDDLSEILPNYNLAKRLTMRKISVGGETTLDDLGEILELLGEIEADDARRDLGLSEKLVAKITKLIRELTRIELEEIQN